MASLKEIKSKVIEQNFFRPRWYSVFINPYYIARASLYSAIKSFAATTPSSAKILDIGCGVKPYRSLFSSSTYIGIDIEGGGHADEQKSVDSFYNGTHIPYPDNEFDTVICTQVLEHADDPALLIHETARVVAPGGTVLFSMPFVYMEHEIPFDFRRFTRFEHMRLMERSGFRDIHIHATTGFFGTFGQLFVILCFEGIRIRAPFLKTLLTLIIFAPIQIVSLTFDSLFGKPALTLDYVITATKA